MEDGNLQWGIYIHINCTQGSSLFIPLLKHGGKICIDCAMLLVKREDTFCAEGRREKLQLLKTPNDMAPPPTPGLSSAFLAPEEEKEAETHPAH